MWWEAFQEACEWSNWGIEWELSGLRSVCDVWDVREDRWELARNKLFRSCSSDRYNCFGWMFCLLLPIESLHWKLEGHQRSSLCHPSSFLVHKEIFHSWYVRNRKMVDGYRLLSLIFLRSSSSFYSSFVVVPFYTAKCPAFSTNTKQDYQESSGRVLVSEKDFLLTFPSCV